MTSRLASLLAELARADGRLDDATTFLQEAMRVAVQAGAWIQALSYLQPMAEVAAADGRPARAATLFAASVALRDAAAWRLSARARDEVAADIERLRSQLPTRAFERAWRRGLSLSLEQAAQLASAPGDDTIADDARAETLTPREREIAGLVAEGLTNRQIATRLVIAPGTVRIHVERILGKLGLTSRVQVATWIVRGEP